MKQRYSINDSPRGKGPTERGRLCRIGSDERNQGNAAAGEQQKHGEQDEVTAHVLAPFRSTMTDPTEYPAPNEQIIPISPSFRSSEYWEKAMIEPAEDVLA